ncbi:hypothetical protein [Corynebacterium aquilae]|uniref:Uncharacterized protein n=1 Tax=Corynebacterium aquilae DSM 44791 TaxID=1431546 RepID=A0A1L7CDF0_9CORY|nr:hypothetical protein [Corynebacterium aquilae]APT83859.1 hypothetical protein CAQU_00780 [Corynebacterium aquilae DSM 44791]
MFGPTTPLARRRIGGMCAAIALSALFGLPTAYAANTQIPAPHIISEDAFGRPAPGGSFALYDQKPTRGVEPIGRYVGIADKNDPSYDPIDPHTEFATDAKVTVGQRYWLKQLNSSATDTALNLQPLEILVKQPGNFVPIVGGEEVYTSCDPRKKNVCDPRLAVKQTPDGIYTVEGSYITVADPRTGEIPRAGGIGVWTVALGAALVIITGLVMTFRQKPATARARTTLSATPATQTPAQVPTQVQAPARPHTPPTPAPTAAPVVANPTVQPAPATAPADIGADTSPNSTPASTPPPAPRTGAPATAEPRLPAQPEATHDAETTAVSPPRTPAPAPAAHAVTSPSPQPAGVQDPQSPAAELSAPQREDLAPVVGFGQDWEEETDLVPDVLPPAFLPDDDAEPYTLATRPAATKPATEVAPATAATAPTTDTSAPTKQDTAKPGHAQPHTPAGHAPAQPAPAAATATRPGHTTKPTNTSADRTDPAATAHSVPLVQRLNLAGKTGQPHVHDIPVPTIDTPPADLVDTMISGRRRTPATTTAQASQAPTAARGATTAQPRPQGPTQRPTRDGQYPETALAKPTKQTKPYFPLHPPLPVFRFELPLATDDNAPTTEPPAAFRHPEKPAVETKAATSTTTPASPWADDPAGLTPWLEQSNQDETTR